ncbi:MAG: SpoIIE family protein phosphatase [Bacteroidota bacterium]|nr:SpoIIE family protein phosphatase [Bacteroidota bacterium]
MRKGSLKFLFAFCFLLPVMHIRSQGLQPLCQNYNTIDYIEDLEFHCATSDNKGTIYFGTNFGVLVYKGERKAQAKGWDFLLLPEADIIYSLYLDTLTNRLYVGGETQLGYFDLKNYYSGTFVSLNDRRSEETKNTQVWHINKINNTFVFHTVKALLVYQNNQLKSIPAPSDAIFHNVFEYTPGKLLINTINKGWYVYDGQLKNVTGSDKLPLDKCYSIINATDNTTYDLFYRNSGVVRIKLNAQNIVSAEKISSVAFDKFLNESQIYNAQLSTDKEKIILATLTQGAFIIKNTYPFDTKNIISETSTSTNIKSAMGLFCDKQNNTWILGKTNLSILPSDLTLFYNDLAGVTVLDMCNTSNGNFVATKNGLYKVNSNYLDPNAITKLSNEIYKKLDVSGDTVFCLRDFGFDKFIGQKIEKKEFEFFANDFCIYDNTVWVAGDDGIRNARATGRDAVTYFRGDNILQLLSFKNNFYAISENKGVLLLDYDFGLLQTIPFDKQFKTLNLALLFIYNGEIALRNIDNTFKWKSNHFVPLNQEVRKIWSHGIITSLPDRVKRKTRVFTFEYDSQNNTHLYLNYGDKPFLVNSFRSTVEVNDIVQAGSSYLIGTKSGLFLSLLHTEKKKEKVNIFNFKTDTIEYDPGSEIFIPFDHSKNIEVLFSLTGFYNKSDNTSYKYRLIGYDSIWKDNYLTRLNFNSLPSGKYTLEIKGIYGNSLETEISQLKFTIGKPWWATWWAMVLFVILAFTLIYTIVQLSIYRLKKSKIRLEKIVTERTLEIATQKNEIEHKNKEITDSINYARRIQSALLTDENYLSENFSNAFILYQPKDIVSGDYYWFNNINGIECIVIADCTGHGVPGAFMSMLGVAKLNEIKAENINQPNIILNRLNRLIFETLGQGKPNTDSRDGMDVAIITIDKANNKLCYAGANRSLVVVNRETKTLEEIKPTKLPVGGSQYGPDRSYQLHETDIKANYSFFLTTDGYADQFGGPNGKKFMTKKLNELFLEIASIPSSSQKQRLLDNYLLWKKNVEQVDDVCVFGINF